MRLLGQGHPALMEQFVELDADRRQTVLVP
jgi:hypothetical protein